MPVLRILAVTLEVELDVPTLLPTATVPLMEIKHVWLVFVIQPCHKRPTTLFHLVLLLPLVAILLPTQKSVHHILQTAKLPAAIIQRDANILRATLPAKLTLLIVLMQYADTELDATTRHSTILTVTMDFPVQQTLAVTLEIRPLDAPTLQSILCVTVQLTETQLV